MRGKAWIVLVGVLVGCQQADLKREEQTDSLIRCAYNLRYSDIDSTRTLALQAFQGAGSYSDGKARALNMLAYVDYQQMDFEAAFHKLDSVGNLTNNQVNLLVRDVMRMKIDQRIGDGLAFFQSRSEAEKRMKRVEEEHRHLGEEDLRNYDFARTEYHIISSTYFFYQDQIRQAREEMQSISRDFQQVCDTTQWLYYNYMLGSGGLLDGPSDEVVLQEFNCLMTCWGFANRMGVTYFQGNALQGLSYLLSNGRNLQLVRENNPGLYNLLVSEHEDWMPCAYTLDGGEALEGVDALDEALAERFMPADSLSSLLSEALAQHALYAFRQYKDLFQMACAYRTLGELSFGRGRYEDALYYYSQALDCVNEQYQRYHSPEDAHHHTEGGRLLSLYDAEHATELGVEIAWIGNPQVYTVPEWISGIRQQISMAYSALGKKPESDYNRNVYLDILYRTGQDMEMESRKLDLQEETAALRLRLLVLLVVFAVLIGLTFWFSYWLRRSNEQKVALRRRAIEMESGEGADMERLEALQEEVEEVQEHVNLYELKLAENKSRNAEKRAKVSLVQAVTPFLDRILNEIGRINRKGKVEAQQLDYIRELTDRIVAYNDLLTDWIQMEKGALSLHVTTLPLNGLFQTLRKGHFAYDQKGIELVVRDTDLVVKADEPLTLFMLNTLADNARKFTPQGGRITIQAEGHEEYVELSVSDTGCGLSPEDVETLNNSKVYDSQKIGLQGVSAQAHDVAKQKGFGFGLMNCKGIIEKYRKTSSLFQVCCFGVESQLGKGSRFFFRLPRVLTLLLVVLSSALSFADDTFRGEGAANSSTVHVSADALDGSYATHASASSAAALYEMAYRCNLEGDYAQTLRYAARALEGIDTCLALYPEPLPFQDCISGKGGMVVTEVDRFLSGDTLDFALCVNLRNEVVVAALALHLWDVYHYNNDICTSLYKLIHQDRSLPTYCERLQRTQAMSRQLQVLLVLLCVLILLVALLFLRRRMSLGKGLMMQRQVSDQLSALAYSEMLRESTQPVELAREMLHVLYQGMRNWQSLCGMRLSLLAAEGESFAEFVEGECREESVRYPLAEGRVLLACFGEAYHRGNTLDELLLKSFSHLLQVRILKVYDTMLGEEVLREKSAHLRFELNRVYVQNQVLDNCLSTIKHESMYYPSRILQLSERLAQHVAGSDGELKPASPAAEDILQLTELAHYYKEVYTLLSSQAEKQVLVSSFRKDTLEVTAYLLEAKRHFDRLAGKRHLNCVLMLQNGDEGADELGVEGHGMADLGVNEQGVANPERKKEGASACCVCADAVLLKELFVQFNQCFVDWLSSASDSAGTNPSVRWNRDAGQLVIAFHLPGVFLTPEEAQTLFYPESKHLHLLVVKQILRELDALNNYPGLRLLAEPAQDGCFIRFTLTRKTVRPEGIETG